MIENADITYLLKYNLWVVVIPLKEGRWQGKIYKRTRNKEWIETHQTIKRTALKAYEWSVPIIFDIVEKKENRKNERNEFYKCNKKITKPKKKMGDKKK